MSKVTMKANQERQGWPWASDVTWAVVWLIAFVLFVLVWATIPA
jgi:ABC-type multidrug transport system permease subunit